MFKQNSDVYINLNHLIFVTVPKTTASSYVDNIIKEFRENFF